MSEIDYSACRGRIKRAADVLGIPPAQVRALLDHGNRKLFAKGDHLIDFARDYGLSLDWLLFDDPQCMLRATQECYGTRPRPRGWHCASLPERHLGACIWPASAGLLH